jgi:N6-adenosine-specific RNA methylase IME4
MPEAFSTLKAWGFEYKTMLTWRKIMSLGMGYWFRGQCEHLLLGVKGNVKAFRQQKANFYESEYFELDECYQSKCGKHSQKPQHFRDLISTAVKVSFTEPKKLELFARSREGMFSDYEYEGWDVFGNEVNNSISLNY